MYETIDRLLAGPPSGASEGELVDWIGRLEEVKCTAEAVQAEAAVRLEEAVRERQSGAGVPARKLGERVASQIALARRLSPEKGAKLLGLAKILIAEMPHTFALMKAGLFSQWQATILARETACLSVDDRKVIDYELCATGLSGEPAKAVSMGLRQLENAAKKLAITLDHSRKAPNGLAELIATRDGGICRNNGCDAPIRNIDHVERHADGGETRAENLQGLCERCNQAMEALGWRARPGPGGRIITITPTGHTYISPPPDTWKPDPPLRLSPAEQRLRGVLRDHIVAA